MGSFNLESIPASELRVLCSTVLEAAEQFYAMDDKKIFKEAKNGIKSDNHSPGSVSGD